MISAPSNRIWPPVGGNSPVRRLKKVVLPAPLGPMTPTASPWRMPNVTWSTAVKLPNRRETARVSRRVAVVI